MEALDKIIKPLGDLYKNAPNLPKGVREFIVVVSPWFALVFGALGVLGTLSVLGIFTFFSAPVMMGGVNAAAGLSLVLIFGLIESAVMLVAVPSLMSRKEMGWKLLFLSEALGVVSTLLTVALGGLIGAVIGFYVLYQIKSSYK
ncbi:MAG: hypothetical protein Q8P80_01805 [Candidatus Levybacteria bacterium]|nr:hypothetical protein [Candidatus Levybacteria bacterium]